MNGQIIHTQLFQRLKNVSLYSNGPPNSVFMGRKAEKSYITLREPSGRILTRTSKVRYLSPQGLIRQRALGNISKASPFGGSRGEASGFKNNFGSSKPLTDRIEK
jgi:hypothetical protein